MVLIGFGTLLWALWTGKTAWKLLQGVSVVALVVVLLMMTWIAFTGLEAKPDVAAGPLAFMTALDLDVS